MEHRTTLRLDASPASITRAAAILRSGGLVGMPTETVYGLAANALNLEAVASIFAAKQRPSWDPLIVHIASPAMLKRVAGPLAPAAQALADAFWPGPLTMLLPRAAGIPDAVTAGRPLVGVRWPAHPVAQHLIHAADLPLAAPSANRFGHISPSTAEHVLADLDGRIDAVIDGGSTDIGLESTVLDPNTTPITLYRQGAVTAAEVERVTGTPVQIFAAASDQAPASLPSPGVGIRHYAPVTPLTLVDTPAQLLMATESSIQSCGALVPDGWTTSRNTVRQAWADWSNSAALAHTLYAGLRALDTRASELHLGRIFVPLPDPRPGDDLRAALRDRLLKAAMPKP